MNLKVKKTISNIFVVLVSPMYLVYLLAGVFSKNNSVAGYSQLLSLVPGRFGSYCRIAFYRLAMRYCAFDCVIGFATIFSQSDTEIGKGVYIGPQCNIGMCKIGDNCLIASGVHIMSGSAQHNFDDLDRPIQQQGGTYTKIVIGEDSWVGNGALIMADIGRKCIIGAGSVVTRDVDDYSIVAGNPAKLIKSRMDP